MDVVRSRSLLSAAAFITVALSSATVADGQDTPVVHELTLTEGWGSRSWNTPATMLRMRVGDTLRIRNLDSTADHTLHTPSTPCPHGGTSVYEADGNQVHDGRNFDPIPVGGWLDCALAEPVENDDDKIYDHFQYNGSAGRFFLSVTER